MPRMHAYIWSPSRLKRRAGTARALKHVTQAAHPNVPTKCRRLEERQLKQQSGSDDARMLRLRAEERAKMLESHQEGLEAREARVALCRQLLHESGRKLEVLRARGGASEEVLRTRSFQLGVASERLRERRQQMGDLAMRRLELRVRLGLARWLPQHLLMEALGGWRAALASRQANLVRAERAVAIWRQATLHRAWRTWRIERAVSGQDPTKKLQMELARREALRLEAKARETLKELRSAPVL